MIYAVKEVYYTLQGEGFHTGRAAVFCRFTGCNLWTGLEKDRSKATCNFCDTDFVGADGKGGGTFKTAQSLATHVRNYWPEDSGTRPYVVCTGGEPLLQLDQSLLNAFHEIDIEVAIETNGTLIPPPGIDWVCVSPKMGSELHLKSGHELKLVYPQQDAAPEQFLNLNFGHYFLQPMDGPNLTENTRLAVEYIKAHPAWKLSMQTHKFLGIP